MVLSVEQSVLQVGLMFRTLWLSIYEKDSDDFWATTPSRVNWLAQKKQFFTKIRKKCFHFFTFFTENLVLEVGHARYH